MTIRHSPMDPTGSDHIFDEIRFPGIETSDFQAHKAPDPSNAIVWTKKPRKVAKIDKQDKSQLDISIFDML